MKTTIIFLPSLLFFIGCLEVLGRRPVRVFHGLGRDCKSETYLPENYKCVETGGEINSFLKSIKDQAIKGCEKLKKEIDILKPSFYVIGFSQGGLIARWIQLHCEGVGPLIKRMVLVGTPNLGIDKLPPSGAFAPKVYTKKEIDEIVEENKEFIEKNNEENKKKMIQQLYDKTNPIKKHAFSSVYKAGVKIGGSMISFFKFLNFAPFNYLNRENRYASLISDLAEGSKTRNLNNLDFLVIIANRDERVVSPPESVTFGMKILDEKGNTIAKPQTSEFIKTHPMIKKLWKEKKLIMCLSHTSHADLEFYENMWITHTIFNEDKGAKDHHSSSIAVKNKLLSEYPNYCAFNNPGNKTSKDVFSETTNGKIGISNIRFALKKTYI